MPRQPLLLAALFTALTFVGCDKQAPTETDEAPEWVKEANERSQKQREAQKNKKAELPGPTRPATQTGDEAAEAPTIERALLWRVKGPNGPVYLFGTIHGGIPGLQWDAFPDQTHEAINASELVVLEADIDNVDAKEVGGLALLPENKSLKKMLGEEHFETLAAESSQPAMMLDLMQPWAAYAELSRIMVGEGRAVDAMVKVEARARDKEVAYLESVREQLEILQSAVTAEMVRDLIANLDKQKQLLATMVDAYKQGDIDALAAAAFKPSEVEKHPELYKLMFYKRNRAWVGEIEKYIERGDVFVAVGAGHLAGDKSVIAMLEDKGHEVERVTDSEKTPSDEQAANDEK